MKRKIVNYNGKSLTIYSGLDDGGFTVAENDIWLPGVYVDEQTALEASRFTSTELDKLSQKICVEAGSFIDKATLDELDK